MIEKIAKINFEWIVTRPITTRSRRKCGTSIPLITNDGEKCVPFFLGVGDLTLHSPEVTRQHCGQGGGSPFSQNFWPLSDHCEQDKACL